MIYPKAPSDHDADRRRDDSIYLSVDFGIVTAAFPRALVFPTDFPL